MNLALGYLSAAIVIGLVGFAAAFGIALLAYKALEGMARQPEATNNLRTTMIIAIAFVESIALYALVIALILVVRT